MPKALPVIDVSPPVCCAPVAAAPMDEDAAVEVALRLKALADPVRLRVLSLLLTRDEACTCDLAPAVGVSDATLSHHIGQLRRAGFVESQRRGMNVFHRVQRDTLAALCHVIDPACC
jgi:DNA-binding transcriptional ArsR family regulator